MSANSFGERFMLRRVPAWHNLGKVYTDPMSAVDAVKEGRMDYQIVKAPCQCSVPTLFGTQLVTAPGMSMLVREPVPDDQEWRTFGVVSDAYEVVQNLELAEILDQVTGGWPVETVGALGHGETFFLTLSVGDDMEIAGDQIKQYFLITDTNDGKTSLRMAFTPVRVVCQNTLVSGLKQATVVSAMSHIAGLKKTVNQRVGLLRQLQDAKFSTLNIFNRMATAILSQDQIDTILEAAYPAPNKPAKVTMLEGMEDFTQSTMPDLFENVSEVNKQWQYYCRLAADRRSQAAVRIDRLNDEFPRIAKTAWAVYNGVVENEDFRDGPATMFESAIFGDRAKAKARAMQSALQFVPQG